MTYIKVAMLVGLLMSFMLGHGVAGARIEALKSPTLRAITSASVTRDDDGTATQVVYNFRDGTSLSISSSSPRSVFENSVRELLQKCAVSWSQLCDLEDLINNFLLQNRISLREVTDGLVRLARVIDETKRTDEGQAITQTPDFYDEFVKDVNQRVGIDIPTNLPGNTQANTVNCWNQVNICLRTQFSDTHRRHHCARGVKECQQDVLASVVQRDALADARLCALLMRQAAARLVLIRG